MTAVQILNQWTEKLVAFRASTGKPANVCVMGKNDFAELSAAIGICYGKALQHMRGDDSRAFCCATVEIMGVTIYVSNVECGYFFGMEPNNS